MSLWKSNKPTISVVRGGAVHSILVSGKIPETGETSRVFFEILSLSRVFLSRDIFRGDFILSRVYWSCLGYFLIFNSCLGYSSLGYFPVAEDTMSLESSDFKDFEISS